MKRKTVFLCYGEGGHKAEIQELLNFLRISDKNKLINFIGIAEGVYSAIPGIKTHFLFPLRNKNNLFWSFTLFPGVLLYDFFKVLWFIIKYKPEALISTGPGSVLLSAMLFRIFNKKIIFIETYSRFYSQSITGKIMYQLADKSYAQNIELLTLYPKMDYAGLL